MQSQTKLWKVERMKTGLGLRRKAKKIFNVANIPFQVGKEKIFCISMQRNGTTSVGDFLADHGYRVAREGDGIRYNWNYYWHMGNFEAIFNSIAFKSFQAYEDSPWWMPDFYKVLFHRFNGSKFILFYRDGNKWFDSMISLKNGKILGNTRRHCKIYRRLNEFYYKLDTDPTFKPTVNDKDQLLRLDHMRDHYINIYEEYNREVCEFFQLMNAQERLFTCNLEDENKWKEIGSFLELMVTKEYNVHSNKTIKS